MSQDAEDRLKRIIETVLEPHFDIFAEVPGRYISTGAGVRIDYMLKAKPEMIERGFTEKPVGLEVKAPERDGDITKAVQLAHQALTYAEAEFPPHGRPAFVLVFPAIDDLVRGSGKQPGHGPEYHAAAIRTLRSLMQKGGVGNLTGRKRNGQMQYSMEFAPSAVYWDSERGVGNLASILNRDDWRGSHK